MIKNSILLLLLLMFSCQSKNSDEAPPIERATLIEIITEALIIEPALRELPKTRQDSIRTVAYEQVFKNKGYTKGEFIKSMQWLQENPLRLAEFYEEIGAKLDEKEAMIGHESKEGQNKK